MDTIEENIKGALQTLSDIGLLREKVLSFKQWDSFLRKTDYELDSVHALLKESLKQLKED